MTRNIFLAFKAVLILLALLLLNCDEKLEQECNAICETKKADFELLTMYVNFRSKGGLIECNYFHFHVRKTATGVIVNYKPWGDYAEWLEAKLSLEEWQTFIKALYKCLDKNLDELGGEDDLCYYGSSFYCTRSLFIYYPDSMYGTTIDRKWDAKPTDWDKVEKTIDDMLSMIKKRAEIPLEAKLKADYQKRFGEPITDIEFSTNGIEFWLITNEKGLCKGPISLFRTKTGALARCELSNYLSNYKWLETELSSEEWLDFIRAIYKNGIYKWEKRYGEQISDYGKKWILAIYYSDKAWFSRMEGYDDYPPNWNEFRKLMDGVEAKMREKGGKK